MGKNRDAATELIRNQIRCAVLDDNKRSVEFEEIPCNDFRAILAHFFPFFIERLDTVEAYTINDETKEKFLMYKAESFDIYSAYQEILRHVKELKPMKYSTTFTVEWKGPYNNESVTSYFYAADMIEVLEKFYIDKERKDYTIFNIKLNPIS